MSAPQRLVVENLSIMFGGVHAVEDVSFTVEPGETFAPTVSYHYYTRH